MSFQNGDVVRLKSGGPWMTLVKTNNDGDYFCRWFHESDIKGFAFKPHELQKYKEEVLDF